jgi:hypothetical protein
VITLNKQGGSGGANNVYEKFLDGHFDDEKMRSIYANSVRTDNE